MFTEMRVEPGDDNSLEKSGNSKYEGDGSIINSQNGHFLMVEET